MDIKFGQFLKEVWGDYRKRFLIFWAIIYFSTVISGLFFLYFNDRLAYLPFQPDKFYYYNLSLILPIPLGLFFSFWGFATLYFYFAGFSLSAAAVSGLNNLLRYFGLVVVGGLAVVMTALIFFVPAIYFLRLFGIVVPPLLPSPASFLNALPVWLLLSAPALYVAILFSNAPLILFLEKKGIIASLKESLQRINAYLKKSCFFLIAGFILAVAVYVAAAVLTILFTNFLVYRGFLDGASTRTLQFLQIFSYAVPWTVAATFYDLFLYHWYLRLLQAKKNGLETSEYESQSANEPGISGNVRDENIAGADKRRIRDFIFWGLTPPKYSRLMKVLTIITLVTFMTVSLTVPLTVHAGFLAIIVVVIAVASIINSFISGDILGGIIQLVGLVVPIVGYLYFAYSLVSYGMGIADALAGAVSTQGIQLTYTTRNVKFNRVIIDPPPTPQQFAQNPNIMATTTIEWQSDAQPGVVNYVRLYDAQTNLPAGTYVSGPAGNVCSSGTQSSVFLLPFARKYRAEIWLASCWQLCRKKGCPRPLCSGCGYDARGVTTEFNVELPTVGVDIKANGSDALGNGSQFIGQPVQLSWNSAYATGECEASGDWSGLQPLFGTATVTPVRGDETYTITCWQPDPKQNPPVQVKEFNQSQDTTTTIFDFSSSTSTFRLDDFGIAYNWCWSGGCFTNSKALPVGETGLIFSAKIADGPGAPGPFCATYVGDGNAYDYCLHIGSSVWLDKELVVSWQGLTDRYINDVVVFYGWAQQYRPYEPGVRPAKWLTRFTVGPQGIGFGSDSVSIAATETAIPPPPPPPPGQVIVFTNPEITSFDVSTPANAGDPISVSWQSRDTSFCQLNTYILDLKVNDSDGPITAVPGDQLKVSWDSSGFSQQFSFCDFAGLPAVGANLSNFLALSGSELISYSQVVPPKTVNLRVECFEGFSAGTSTSSIPSVVDFVPINLVTPPSASTVFFLGRQVQTTSNVNVRSTPSQYGLILGTQVLGATGTVVGGPVYANGFWWWQIDYANLPDGWSVENYLQ